MIKFIPLAASQSDVLCLCDLFYSLGLRGAVDDGKACWVLEQPSGGDSVGRYAVFKSQLFEKLVQFGISDIAYKGFILALIRRIALYL